MQKTKDINNTSKRPHYSGKEDNSTDEELNKTVPRKPREKKIKERTSPPTTDCDEEERAMVKGNNETHQDQTKTKPDYNQEVVDKIVKSTGQVSLQLNKSAMEMETEDEKEKIIEEKRKGGPPKSTCNYDDMNDDNNTKSDNDHDTGKPINESDNRYEHDTGKLVCDDQPIEKHENDQNDNKITENEAEKQANLMEEVRETYDRTESKPNPFKYDYLGKEVEKDEAEALEALSLYWLNNIARKANKLKNKIREEDKPFYSKYCNVINGNKQLKIEEAMRLMSLPHVVTVTLKPIAKIEVVVSDVALALQDSPELQCDDFEVTEAMGMHLF